MKKILSVLITVSMVFMFVGVATAGLTEGLIAYYPFNGNANDESGNGHDGTVNGASLTEDRFGNPDSAYSFDGNDVISVPDDTIFTFGANPFTVSVWVNFSQVQGRDPFIGHDEGSGQHNKWVFWYDASGHNKPSGPALRFHINSPTLPALDPAYAPWQPNTGQWYHVVVTRNGNVYTQYINGVQVSSENDSNSIPDPNTALTIGKAEAYFMNGSIDDTRIYNRALTEAEIVELYNEGNAILTISPPSGDYVTTQGFDLTLIVDAPGLSVVGGSATLNGCDVTAGLASCVIPGTLVSGGLTLRCPGLTSGIFGTGAHTLDVTLDLSDGSSVSDIVIWDVKENTEP